MCRPIASRIASSMSGKREGKDVPAPMFDVEGGTKNSVVWGKLGPVSGGGPEGATVAVALEEGSAESCADNCCMVAC